MYVHVLLHVCMYACMHACMYECMCIYIHTQIYTHVRESRAIKSMYQLTALVGIGSAFLWCPVLVDCRDSLKQLRLEGNGSLLLGGSNYL